MTSYYERRYRKSDQHKRHVKRRRYRKTKLLLMILGSLCVLVALIVGVLSFLVDTPAEQRKWLIFSGLYLGAGLLLFLVRWGMLAYSRLRQRRTDG